MEKYTSIGKFVSNDLYQNQMPKIEAMIIELPRMQAEIAGLWKTKSLYSRTIYVVSDKWVEANHGAEGRVSKLLE